MALSSSAGLPDASFPEVLLGGSTVLLFRSGRFLLFLLFCCRDAPVFLCMERKLARSRFFLSRSFDVVLSFWQAALVGGHMKRPWDSRKLLRIVEIPRVDGVRACDEMIEYEYKFGYNITSIYSSELFSFSFLISD